MCLIAVLPEKKKRQSVSDAWLENIYQRNRDGYGFMWRNSVGRLRYRKAVGSVDDFIDSFRLLDEVVHNGFCMHVRLKTHGVISDDQSHPYAVDTDDLDTAGVMLMHNGILHTSNLSDTTKSDTWHFVRDYLRGMSRYRDGELFRDTNIMRMIGDYIKSTNKLVILTKHGSTIINASSGINWKGMWLSNDYAWDAAKFGVVSHDYGGYRSGYSSSYYAEPRWSNAIGNPGTRLSLQPKNGKLVKKDKPHVIVRNGSFVDRNVGTLLPWAYAYDKAVEFLSTCEHMNYLKASDYNVSALATEFSKLTYGEYAEMVDSLDLGDFDEVTVRCYLAGFIWGKGKTDTLISDSIDY